ncbi:MAG: replication initiator protein A [Lachnospiraceae bacterium]|nr:replication initiator protein A [Lachnospiraceae bacterium]
MNENKINRFVKMPFQLYGSDEYADLSSDAKILYAMIRNRQEIAFRFNQPEADGRYPIYFTVQEVMKLLNCGNKKAIRVFRELEDIRLIDRVRQGQTKPSKIYARVDL